MALVNNSGLASILNSRAPGGIVTSDGNAGVAKSLLFAGIAKIASFFSPKLREENIQAKQNFLQSMQKEFGFNDREYQRMAEKIDVESGAPLKLSYARKIVSVFAEHRAELSEKQKDYGNFTSENRHREANATEQEDTESGRIRIGDGAMRNLLVKLHDKGASNSELRQEVATWLRLGDEDASPSSVDKAMKQFGF